MFEDMGVFKIYSAMARHAAEAQTHASKNIAHSDDPGYRATSLESFEEYLKRTSVSPSESEAFKITDRGTPTAPNGNSVSVEHELYKSAEAMDQHQLALTVYSKSLDLLRAALGRR